nr:MAG TPA: hypothetical protein [Caudoviricetes sp.]
MRGWRMNWYWLQLNISNRGAVKSTPLFFCTFLKLAVVLILNMLYNIIKGKIYIN